MEGQWLMFLLLLEQGADAQCRYYRLELERMGEVVVLGWR